MALMLFREGIAEFHADAFFKVGSHGFFSRKPIMKLRISFSSSLRKNL